MSDEKFDTAVIDEILGSEKLTCDITRCLLDAGPCAPDGEELKKVIPEALQSGCKQCTEKQRVMSEKFVRFMYENKQDIFTKLEEKYDPTKKYRNQFKKEA